MTKAQQYYNELNLSSNNGIDYAHVADYLENMSTDIGQDWGAGTTTYYFDDKSAVEWHWGYFNII
jgi:hypothetical protein